MPRRGDHCRDTVVTSSRAETTSGIDTSNFDHSVRPQDDFFRYVNGGWLKKTEIPATHRAGARSRTSPRQSQRAARHPRETSHASRVARREEGRRSLRQLHGLRAHRETRIHATGRELKSIAAFKATSELPAALAHFARLVVQGPLGISVGQDPKASSVNITQEASQASAFPIGLLPEDRREMAATHAAYLDYITQLMRLANSRIRPAPPSASSRSKHRLRRRSGGRARQRDRNATYNKMTIAESRDVSVVQLGDVLRDADSARQR